jgi:hypothetical protein
MRIFYLLAFLLFSITTAHTQIEQLPRPPRLPFSPSEFIKTPLTCHPDSVLQYQATQAGLDSVLHQKFIFDYLPDGKLVAQRLWDRSTMTFSDQHQITWDNQSRISSWIGEKNGTKDSTYYAYLSTTDLVDTFITKYWFMGNRPPTLGYLKYNSMLQLKTATYYTNGGPNFGPPDSWNYFYNADGLTDSIQHVYFQIPFGFGYSNQYFTYYPNDSIKTRLRVQNYHDTLEMVRHGYEPSLRLDSFYISTFASPKIIDSILYNADGFPETHLYHYIGSGQTLLRTVQYRPGCACPIEISEYSDTSIPLQSKLTRRWRYYYSGNCTDIISDPRPTDLPILVYPNPTTGTLRSAFNDQLNAEALYSIDGKLIIAFNPPKALYLGIHLDGVAAGVYMLKTRKADGQMITFKVMVE